MCGMHLGQQVASTVLHEGWVPGEGNWTMLMAADCWQHVELCASWMPGEKDGAGNLATLMAAFCWHLVDLCSGWVPGEKDMLMLVAVDRG